MKKVKIGLIGLGTVGKGVYKTLQNFENIEITKIAVRDKNKQRNIDNLDKNLLTENPYDVVNDAENDIIVELIGGVNPAFDLIKTAIKNGKHIVTANKELLAKHGEELFNYAEQYNRVILYEAAIAGGIPIIMPIKTILAGNKISEIKAILNGTTNYILTKMDTEGESYPKVLKEAQELGYAEADPSSDVEGFDTMYKITTLATIAFNSRVKLENVYREGITNIRADDIKNANELGYKIKLIAYAKLDEEGADVRVHPMFVPKKTSLAHINYVTNAINITGEPIGEITLSGAGAGEKPTASSVVGDIIVIANELGTSDYILPMMRCKHVSVVHPKNILDTENKYYLNITATDKVGGMAEIMSIFAKNNINLSSVLLKEVTKNKKAHITIVTETCQERKINETIAELLAESFIDKINNKIRVAE